MAIFKDLLIKGIYYVENGATDSESWTEMMICDCGQKLRPHLNYIMQHSFMNVYKKAGTNVSLRRKLRRELKKMKKINKTRDMDI